VSFDETNVNIYFRRAKMSLICCTECNCFGHAESCSYNASIEERQLSLNIHGEYQGGGVCNDCMVRMVASVTLILGGNAYIYI